MAYVPITTGEITTGEPVASTTQAKIKDNFADHETRIDALEVGSNIDYPPIILRVNGPYHRYGVQSKLLVTTINLNIAPTGGRLIVDTAGSSGTTEIDVFYKRGAGAWTSIFSTKPTVASSAGDYGVSTNGVITAALELQAGDLIALDITQSQVHATSSAGKGFTVRLDYERV